MTPDELERAVTMPAQAANVSFEGGVTARLVAEANEQPGALPLLQFALTELFDNHVGGVITLARYEEIGGLQKTLAAQAEKVYESLDEEQQEIARQLFLRLITLGEGSEDTRRRAPMTELTGTTDAEATRYVVEYLAANRLLTTDIDPATREPSVEVAHEALIREWERLRGWLEESRGDIRMQRLLNHAATQWERGKRDESYLLRGSRLTRYAGWAAETDIAISDNERAFLDTSAAEAEKRERRLRAIRNAAFAITAVIAVALAGLSIFAFGQSATAERERDNAELAADESLSVALAASAREEFANENRGLALALAIEANEIPNPPASVRRTLADISNAPGLRATMGEDQISTISLAISPDGRYALTGEGGPRFDAARAADPEVRARVFLWDLETGVEARRFGAEGEGHNGSILDVIFADDGQSFFSSGANNRAFHWDIETGEILQRYTLPDEGYLSKLALGPDGTLVSQACTLGQVGRGCDGEFLVIVWDIETGAEIWRQSYHAVVNGNDMEVSPDRQSLYIHAFDIEHFEQVGESWGFLVKVDLATGEEVWRTNFPTATSFSTVRSFAVSPDSAMVLVGRIDGRIFLLDAETGDEIRTFELTSNDVRVFGVDFSPDGKTALSAHQDGRVSVWDVTQGRRLMTFTEHETRVREALFTPDGLQAVSASEDGAVHVWDIAHATERRRFRADDVVGLWGVAVSSDGRRLYTGGGGNDFQPPVENNPLIEWDIETGEEIRRFEGHPAALWEIILSPDGETLLTASRDIEEDMPITGNQATLRWWDLTTGEEIQQFDPEVDQTFTIDVALSPDGRSALASTLSDSMVRLWDLESGVEIQRFLRDDPRQGEESMGVAAFSPDPRVIASGGFDGVIQLWDRDSGEEIQRLEGHEGIVSDLYFMTGDRLLSASWDLTIRLWDLQTGEEIRRYEGLGGGNTALSPDGRRIVYATPDHSLILMDIDNGEELASFVGHTNTPYKMVFSADGQYIFSASWDGTGAHVGHPTGVG